MDNTAVDNTSDMIVNKLSGCIGGMVILGLLGLLLYQIYSRISYEAAVILLLIWIVYNTSPICKENSNNYTRQRGQK